jgi:hypothetical protein
MCTASLPLGYNRKSSKIFEVGEAKVAFSHLCCVLDLSSYCLMDCHIVLDKLHCLMVDKNIFLSSNL